MKLYGRCLETICNKYNIMSSTVLHILNGDDTLTGFNDTGLDGDVLVWREVFSEGPLSETLNADFWTDRELWIVQAFEDAPERYQQLVLRELEKLNTPYAEINLWFEFDLHCQVNLLGVMQILKQKVDLSEKAIYLISPDSYPGMDDFRGMGQLNGEQLENVFDNRLQLTDYDFTIAAEAWQLYIGNDAERIQQWLNDTPFWGSLHNLKPALQAHVKRLHTNEQGLTFIEAKLLHLYQNGIISKNDLYRAFWQQNVIYGMGDMELDIYFNKLKFKGLIAES